MLTNPYRVRALVFLLFAVLLLAYLLLDAQNAGRKPARRDEANAGVDEPYQYDPEIEASEIIRAAEQAVLDEELRDTTRWEPSAREAGAYGASARPHTIEELTGDLRRETAVIAGQAGHALPSAGPGDPRLLREISRATAAERYDQAAQLLLESRAGERLLDGDPASRAEWQRRLSRGFAYLARETGVHDAAADARRLMADTRVADVVNTMGLDERGMRQMLQTYYTYLERERSAPGNPRPLDIEPRTEP